MQAFTDEQILTSEEVDEVIISAFNPVRVKFEGIAEIVTEDILNCGVSPKRLLEILKLRYLQAGGYASAFHKVKIRTEVLQHFRIDSEISRWCFLRARPSTSHLLLTNQIDQYDAIQYF